MVAAKRLAGVAFKGDVRNQSIMLNPSETHTGEIYPGLVTLGNHQL